MFDLRYHVASLAAVFLALVVGILVGVGISGRGFVDKSERTKLNNQIAALQGQVGSQRAAIDELNAEQQAGKSFIADAYPVLMQNRLAGKRIAIVVVGSAAGRVGADVDTALTDAGADTVRFRALKAPIEPGAIDGALRARKALTAYAGPKQLGAVGRELGQELVTGGKTPLWDALSTQVVEEQRGHAGQPVDGVVVIRAAGPQQGATARFLGGLYAGIGSAGVPAVGVEATGTRPSAVPVFAHGGLSTVDDVDMPQGRLALALLLAGGDRGSYGVKKGADGLLPTIQPVPPKPGA